jgi:gluconokinase
LPAEIPVVIGSGDGFLANIGSGCETPGKIAVTLGTSAVVRQTVYRPVVNSTLGTFCYRAGGDAWLLGCAGSNGGNVLDWGKQVLGARDEAASEEPPIFLPLLNGERSPDWDPALQGSWHGLRARHSAADLARSILEGVIFNLAHFVEIVQAGSGQPGTDAVLSGNGFLKPLAAPILAGVTGLVVRSPKVPGLASLRGAAICALRALSQPAPQLELETVAPLTRPNIAARYAEYRRLRSRLSSAGFRG